LFQKANLIDVLPSNLSPTWRNGRAGEVSLVKRLDRFFLAKGLAKSVGRYRSWI